MTDVLMARLATATTEEGKTVTYKWVARELDVSVNHAKRLLFAHSRKNDSVLVATHVVSGWTSVAVARRAMSTSVIVARRCARRRRVSVCRGSARPRRR